MKRPTGFKGFAIMSVGEIVSLTGSAMTDFGIGIWIWKETGNATPFSILVAAFFVANLIFSPIAGVFVDRWPRKRSLILPDLISALITLLTLLLYISGRLSLPFLYASAFVSGVFNGFQWSAYSVTISEMLKKEEYGKANGLFSMTKSWPSFVAPAVAGFLLPFFKLTGIMIIDLLSFIAAFGAILWVKITENKFFGNLRGVKNILKESLFGFKYIYKVKPLFFLLLVFLSMNFFFYTWMPLVSPMVLSKFHNSSRILGMVQSAFGAAGVAGGVLMTVWGGTKRKTVSLFGGIIICSMGIIFLGISRTVVSIILSLVVIAVANVVTNASSQAIWQKIVPVRIQGRVFSARMFLSQFAALVPMALSGPFVDLYLTKRVNSSKVLVSLFGGGKGGAVSLLAFVSGVVVMVIGIAALFSPAIMGVENTDP